MSFTVPHYFELVMITNLAFEDVSWFIFAKSARAVFLLFIILVFNIDYFIITLCDVLVEVGRRFALLFSFELAR